MNCIPGDIFKAGGEGGRETPFASSPCFSPEHRNSVPQHRPFTDASWHIASAYIRLRLCRYSMLFHKSQPCLSGTARRQWKGLSPCTPVTKPVETKDHNDFSIPTYIYIYLCKRVYAQTYPGAVYGHTGKTAYHMRLSCLWIYAG